MMKAQWSISPATATGDHRVSFEKRVEDFDEHDLDFQTHP